MDERTTAVVGLKHAGKTTLTAAAAEQLSISWADLDHLMVDAARDEGWFAADGTLTPLVRQLYQRIGRAAFLDWEAAIVQRVVSHDPRPHLLATGGGICENERAWPLVCERFRIVYLVQDPQILFDRISRWGLPSFLSTEDPKADFLRICGRREAIYRAAADAIIDLRSLSDPEAVDALTETLRAFGHGR